MLDVNRSLKPAEDTTGSKIVVPAAAPVMIIDGLFRAVDILSMLIGGILWIILRGNSISEAQLSNHVTALMLGTLLFAFIAGRLGTYDPMTRFDYMAASKQLIFSLISSALVLASIGAALKINENYSRLWFIGWFGTALVVSLLLRVAVHTQLTKMRRLGRFDTRTVIVGAGDQGQQLSQFLQSNKKLTINLLGFIDDRRDRLAPRIDGMPVIGGLDSLMAMIKRSEVDQVMIALPWYAHKRINDVVSVLAMAPVKIRLASDLVGFAYINKTVSMLGGLPVFNLFDRPISGLSYVIKLLEDTILGIFIAIILSPIMLIIAIVVKMDTPGPVFFRQLREGFNHKPILVWKFRSMRTDLCETTDITQATKRDPRITRSGAFLRRTSLDELPQIFNVLKGEMSIVGPRPHAPSTKAAGKEFHTIIHNYASRHRVKPGITGWAQVNGYRGETDTEDKLIKRVEHDLYYIDNWSVWFDIMIMIKTFMSVIKAENAY